MTAFLYYSISSKLTEEEKRDIDRSVLKNRVDVSKFVKKVYGKGKVTVICTTFGIAIFCSAIGIGNANAIGLSPIPQAPIMR